MPALLTLPVLSPLPATHHHLGPADAYEAHVRAAMGTRAAALLSDGDEVLLPAVLCPRLAVVAGREGTLHDLSSARVTSHVVAGD